MAVISFLDLKRLRPSHLVLTINLPNESDVAVIFVMLLTHEK